MNLCQPRHEAVFKQRMMLKAKQAKLKWCILGVVAQSKAGINLGSGQRLWISCYTPFRAVSERNLATRLRVVSVWPICWRLLISVSFFPMLRGWSGPKWWWLSAEITNMRWTLMPAGLRGGHQAKLDVKAGKIYVVLYFPAYCYRSSDKNYVKWHLRYRNLFAVKSAVIHRFSLAFHSRSITRSCCPLPLLSCYCSLYTQDGTGHHSEIILDCIIVRYSAVVMDNILCT